MTASGVAVLVLAAIVTVAVIVALLRDLANDLDDRLDCWCPPDRHDHRCER